MLRTFFKVSALCALVLCACDLQPKIASIPDDIGMFIEDRYPALLADPDTQPEIYNSAATDYGVYASPELYGSSSMDDYVLYASVDDYVLMPEEVEETEEVAEIKTEDEPEVEEDTDYLLVPTYTKKIVNEEKQQKKEQDGIIIVAKGDTVYSLARKNNMSIDEFAKINNLKEPYTLSIGQKLTTSRKAEVVAVKKETPKVVEKAKEIKTEKVAVKEPIKPTDTKRVDLQEITVQKGDTLYSLSRKYEIPVNDLAVMNKLSSPFELNVGQKIKVPKLDNVKTASVSEIKTVSAKQSTSAKAKTTAKITPAKKVVRQVTVKEIKPATTIKETKTATVAKNTVAKTQSSSVVKNVAKSAPQKTVVAKTATQPKISSNPKKQLPKVVARSSSKFSWPVRGKILSAYGAKNNGLFNDGINIAASQGTIVKAAENGVVAYAGNEVKGMGNLIIIQHSDGWMTVYAHLDSMSVRRGARVNVGTPIGRVGKTGKVDQPQLHFEIRKGTKAYNPTKYLKK